MAEFGYGAYDSCGWGPEEITGPVISKILGLNLR